MRVEAWEVGRRGRIWVEELALPRRKILLVGDTLHDLEVARELGVDCVLVAAGHHPESRLRARTQRVFPTLRALLASSEILRS